MSLKGKWRITKMPDFEADYPDMMEPAYIQFEENGSGEFAFGCCTGHIWQASSTEAASIDFSWTGNDEMNEVKRRRLRRTSARRLPPRRNLLPQWR